MNISDYLHNGAEHPQTAAELCELLHIDKRELTAAIERERRAGSPICASCSTDAPGYFLASTKDEMKLYCKKLQHRAREINETRKACLNTLDRLPTKRRADNAE